MKMQIDIGASIRKARLQAGFTQKELADKIGMAEITIRKYESNEREPKIPTLFNIMKILDPSNSTSELKELRKYLEWELDGEYKKMVYGFTAQPLDDELIDLANIILNHLKNSELEEIISIMQAVNNETSNNSRITMDINKNLSFMNDTGKQKTLDYTNDLIRNPDNLKGK